MGLLDDLRKRAEKSDKHWEAIDMVKTEIEKSIKELSKLQIQEEQKIPYNLMLRNASLLLLLVEHLRPLASGTEQLGELEEGLESLGKMLGG